MRLLSLFLRLNVKCRASRDSKQTWDTFYKLGSIHGNIPLLSRGFRRMERRRQDVTYSRRLRPIAAAGTN